MTQATGSPARRFEPYSAYKPSGIDWLGPIPATWNMARLKHRCRFFGGGTPAKDNAGYWSGDIPWVSPKDMKADVVEDSEEHISEEGLRNSATRLVGPGAVLVVVRSGILRRAIPVAINLRPVALNQDMKAVVPDSGLLADYLAFVIRGNQEALLVEWRKAGATVESLEQDLLANQLVPIPPVPEQQAIAAFLDRETAKIDALVAKKERLIELLEEQRAALITRAVTKGLEPNAPMSDSAVEWVSRVPAAWSIERNKVLFRERDERSFGGDEELLTVSHITGVTRRSEKDVNMIEAESYEGYKLCRPGDLVINTMWAWMGALGMAREAGMVSPSYNVYCPERSVVPDYFDYLCRIPAYVSELTRYSKGVWKSRLRLYPEDFMEIRTILPSAAEQESVVRFLNREVTRINGLIAKVRDAIGRLLEYRTALISAAATGKIDVRST